MVRRGFLYISLIRSSNAPIGFWMRKMTCLLRQDQLHRAVVGAEYPVVDDHIFYEGN